MIPYKELNRRINKLQAAMQENHLAGALLVQRADLFYFSGTGQNAHLFVPAEGEPFLIVKKSILRAEEESALKKIIPFKGWGELASLIARTVPKGSTIGLENDVLPANLYFRYQKLLDGFATADVSGAIRSIRAVKSAYELDVMSKAATISEAVFSYAREIIREGLSEVELAGQLEFKARKMGHQGAVRMRGFNQELYFGHIMAGESASAVSFFDGPTGGRGLNPSYPQGAGLSGVKKHEPVLVDFVSVYEGYMVDQTRIFCLGEPPLHLLEAYNSAVEIKHTLAREGKPGVSGSALFSQAENQAVQAGLANHFMGYTEKVSFVGHGVGIELDELPVIARGLELPLEEGMVFALEPKFIFPGEGVVGIEDTFVVRQGGLEQITRFSDQLQII
jgi:Xaa-Pro aminopeptidase